MCCASSSSILAKSSFIVLSSRRRVVSSLARVEAQPEPSQSRVRSALAGVVVLVLALGKTIQTLMLEFGMLVD